jgi:hypothetical protein
LAANLINPPRLIITFFLGVSLLMGAGSGWSASDVGDRSDYSLLFDYIAKSDLESPLVLIEDHQGDFDQDRNRENMAYLNGNTALLEKIKGKFKGDAVQWKLSNSSKRLLAVPEEREEYAYLFERYCNDAVGYVLDRLHMPNPFGAISTLHGPLSEAARSVSDEKTAIYLVHNVAEEYVEEYLFFDPEGEDTKIKIKLSNKVYSGIIGSYSSQLVIGENSQFKFIREPYTLWQNSAINPLNVLIVPVEETLHALMREATEGAIQDQLKQIQPQHISEVQDVIDHWMAVEESIVGGLVEQLMPGLLNRVVLHPPDDLMDEAWANRQEHEQYRYLNQGRRMVADLGVEAALALYRTDPLKFSHLVDLADQEKDQASL